MNFSEIKEMVTMINQSELTEFRLKDQQFELYLNKNQQCGLASQTEGLPHLEVKNSSVVPANNLETSILTQVEMDDEPTIIDSEGHVISSPLVGVVYLKPSPDKAVFKQVGEQVKAGEILCIIEAMKVMNEIVSDVNGEITAILVENEEVVEFGQPLIQIKEN
jgi:acetyl-CoA carboxylase biotin carboxyl carrier protein